MSEGVRVVFYDDLADAGSKNIADVARYVDSNSSKANGMLLRSSLLSLLCCLVLAYAATVYGPVNPYIYADVTLYALQSIGFLVSCSCIGLYQTEAFAGDIDSAAFVGVRSFKLSLLAIALLSVGVLVAIAHILSLLSAHLASAAANFDKDMRSLYLSVCSTLLAILLICSVRLRVNSADAIQFLRKGLRPCERMVEKKPKKQSYGYGLSTMKRSTLLDSTCRGTYGSTASAAEGESDGKRKTYRVRRSSVGPESVHTVGTKVLAQPGADPDALWFRGIISSIHRDGTYDVVYEDGDIEFHKSRTRIELLSSVHTSDRSSSSMYVNGDGLVHLWKVSLFAHFVATIVGAILSIVLAIWGAQSGIVLAFSASFTAGLLCFVCYVFAVNLYHLANVILSYRYDTSLLDARSLEVAAILLRLQLRLFPYTRYNLFTALRVFN